MRFLIVLIEIIVCIALFLAGYMAGGLVEEHNSKAKVEQATTICRFTLNAQKDVSDSWKNLALSGLTVADMLKTKYQDCKATCCHQGDTNAQKKASESH